MTENDKLQMFEDRPIRTAWDEMQEEWYFSIVDVVTVLTESGDYNTGRKYWNKLKQRLKAEGSELVTNCHQLKMKAADGKRRLTDVANTEQLLRIIQSVPSKKAEPFKMWLAMVGRERIEEIIDPELTIERALDTYAQKGYSPEWINQRLQTIRARKELTDAWKLHGVKEGQEYAILTDEVTKAWSGMNTRQYKNFWPRILLDATIPLIILFAFGAPLVEAINSVIPAWLLSGFKTAGNMLPAIGFAILLRSMNIKGNFQYVIIGFVLYAYLGIGALGAALVGVALAMIAYQNNVRIAEAQNMGGVGDE